MANSVKRELRRAVDHAARWLGILDRCERAGSGALTVLTYHRVLGLERCRDYPFPTLAMPIDAFREQVRWLASHNHVLPLGEALELNRSGPRPSRPLVTLTFDDGYADSTEAAQVLEESGVRGTFFVTTGFVGSRELLWFDRAALLFAGLPGPERSEITRELCSANPNQFFPDVEASPAAWVSFLKRCSPEQRSSILTMLESVAGGVPPSDGYRAMSIADVKALHAHGHEIGSHTVTHALMPELDERSLQREVEEARDTLTEWLGTSVRGFCYPNGDCDARVVAAVSRAGHTHACTTRDGIHRPEDDPLRIQRVDIVPDRALDASSAFDATAFRRELCGLYRRRREESARK